MKKSETRIIDEYNLKMILRLQLTLKDPLLRTSFIKRHLAKYHSTKMTSIQKTKMRQLSKISKRT